MRQKYDDVFPFSVVLVLIVLVVLMTGLAVEHVTCVHARRVAAGETIHPAEKGTP